MYQEMSAMLSLIQYCPDYRSPPHVAYYVEVADGNKHEHFIYQVVGSATEMQYGHLEGVVPNHSALYLGRHVVTDQINKETLDSVKNRLETCPIDNDIATFDCQDWCLKALELLHHDELVDDEVYYSTKEYLSVRG